MARGIAKNSLTILLQSHLLVLILMIKSTESNKLIGPYSYKELYCRFASNNKIESCPYGSYIDVCGHNTCYKGLGEACDIMPSGVPQFGQCNPNLSCVCGECSGCQNDVCRLELCKRNGFHEKKQTNLIAPDYYYL